MYCEYCGELLSKGCRCEIELENERLQFIEDYENNPMVQYGWAQQDMIENSHFNQR